MTVIAGVSLIFLAAPCALAARTGAAHMPRAAMRVMIWARLR